MPIELRLGKMTNQELAEWFGISKETLVPHKNYYLRRLNKFAAYEKYYGGVNILEIYMPIYIENKKAYDIIEEHFMKTWSATGYDTCTRVGMEMYNTHFKGKGENNEDIIKQSTATHYVQQVKRKFFGRNHIKEYGLKGWCEFRWCKDRGIDENGMPFTLLLTEVEKAKLNEISIKIYHNKDLALWEDAVKKGEMSSNEYEEAVEDWLSSEKRAERYWKFVEEVTEALGYFPKKTTYIKEENIFDAAAPVGKKSSTSKST